ncbi:YHS domain-containing (seleno)protein [Enterovibrio coralii]|uniref:YHS domain protein n=1 Tax=Enterovibrio coralii TaxID=294935 RepID=A0A135IAA8_9GAMM|nr:YHS domain-containing (seleno)protein [Enterovibrio coralii]KXF82396.1 YHS domain protein [Enterovibrio coralii]
MRHLLLILSLFFSSFSFASQEIYTGLFNSDAVSGYDTVSFFEGKPVKGSSKYQTEYMDADWLFSSQENLDKFKADPTKYAPQYGGHCAWAIAANDGLAPGDPTYWKIVDGKLYLNYDKSVWNKWNKDIPGFIEQGDINWAKRAN